MRLLLQYSVDVNHADQLGNTALLTAVEYNRQTATLLLLRFNCDVNTIGACRPTGTFNGLDRNSAAVCVQRDALELAILEGRWNLAKILCEYGANVHEKFKYLEHQRLMEKMQPLIEMNRTMPAWLVEAISNPQTMKEMSRNAVRKHLPSGCLVIAAIQSLPLPTSLKDYVDLEELRDV